MDWLFQKLQADEDDFNFQQDRTLPQRVPKFTDF